MVASTRLTVKFLFTNKSATQSTSASGTSDVDVTYYKVWVLILVNYGRRKTNIARVCNAKVVNSNIILKITLK